MIIPRYVRWCINIILSIADITYRIKLCSLLFLWCTAVLKKILMPRMLKPSSDPQFTLDNNRDRRRREFAINSRLTTHIFMTNTDAEDELQKWLEAVRQGIESEEIHETRMISGKKEIRGSVIRPRLLEDSSDSEDDDSGM